MQELEIREEVSRQRVLLEKELSELEKEHRHKKAVIEKKHEENQARCPHLRATGGPGLWACPDCGSTEFYRDE